MKLRPENFWYTISAVLFAYAMFLTWQRIDPKWVQIGSSVRKAETPVYSDIRPIRIEIPSVGINLPVYASLVKNGIWETTDVGVSYWKRTPVPGEIGNSVLYGHNWPNLLGNLHRVKPGDTIIIYYNQGQPKTFVVSYMNTVDPNDVDVIHPSPDRRITVYTCTGLFDSKRLVISAIVSSEQLSLGHTTLSAY